MFINCELEGPQTLMNSQVLYFAGRTGHTEVVRVVFHPEQISFANLLKVFWESHNPTQGTTSATDTLITEPLKENREFASTDKHNENVPKTVL